MKSFISIIIIGLFCYSCKQKVNDKHVSQQYVASSKPDIISFSDSITTVEHYYRALSYLYNYKVKFTRKYNKGKFLSECWTIIIYDKRTKYKLDSLSQPMISYETDFPDFKTARSLITGLNNKKIAVDNDFGDLVIADLNFDSKEDIALVNDLGGNGGRVYSFYIQQKNKTFLLDNYLTDSMIYFPSRLVKKNKQLITYVHAGVGGLGEHNYTIDQKQKSWKLISHRIFNLHN